MKFFKITSFVLLSCMTLSMPLSTAIAAEESVMDEESMGASEFEAEETEAVSLPGSESMADQTGSGANEEATETGVSAEEENAARKRNSQRQGGEMSAPVYDENDLHRNTEKADSYNAIIYQNEDWDDVGPAVDDSYGGLSVKDYNALVRMVYAEAGGEGEEGMLLVANVILNRTKSYKYPATVTEVISQNGQFQPYATGRYAQVEPSETAVKAVRRALNGENNAPGVLYFKSVHSKAVWANKTVAFRYRNHIFYY